MFWLFQTRNVVTVHRETSAVAVKFAQGVIFRPEATWVAELFATASRERGVAGITRLARR